MHLAILSTLAAALACTVTGSPVATVNTPRDASSYAATAVEHHNTHRRAHSAADVTWDDRLAGNALELANRCVFEHDQSIGGGGYGQNIADHTSFAFDGSENPEDMLVLEIDQSWYSSEVGNYASYFGRPSPPPEDPQHQFLHFTQLVWKSTTNIGCATAFCPTGTSIGANFNGWFTVCNHGPAGNILGEFDKNVSPAS